MHYYENSEHSLVEHTGTDKLTVLKLTVFILLKFCSAGQDRALLDTISTLESVKMKPVADDLRNRCKRGK